MQKADNISRKLVNLFQVRRKHLPSGKNNCIMYAVFALRSVSIDASVQDKKSDDVSSVREFVKSSLEQF